MDFADCLLFTPDFASENELDFSGLISTPSTSFHEPNPCNPIIHCADIEDDVKQKVCETTTTTDENTKGDDEPTNKRAKHKETEKQRRKEVTSLFKKLRYILPVQYIKGKRSSSDHVQEAVNYIKDLQKKIKEAREKRDRIKRSITHPSSTGECSIRSLASSSSSPSPLSILSNCSCVGDTHIDVVVRPCLIGIEILASCCFRHQACLSSVLQLLAQEQCLNVVSCITTRLHQRLMHTIVSEVEEGMEVNFSEVQEKIIKIGTS